MNANELAIKAPAMPQHKGRFYGVYLKPVMFSGERITIAVIAAGCGLQDIVRTISDAKLACMYNANAPAITTLVNVILESAKQHIDSGQPIEGWMPPFQGVHLSQIYEWRGHDFTTLTNQAIRSLASLYEGDLVIKNDQ